MEKVKYLVLRAFSCIPKDYGKLNGGWIIEDLGILDEIEEISLSYNYLIKELIEGGYIIPLTIYRENRINEILDEDENDEKMV